MIMKGVLKTILFVQQESMHLAKDSILDPLPPPPTMQEHGTHWGKPNTGAVGEIWNCSQLPILGLG